MLTVAFGASGSRNFVALFYMLLTQLAGNQIVVNILEYIRPLILARQQLKEHHAAYKDVLAQYKDLGRPGSRGERAGERVSANKVNAEKSTNDAGKKQGGHNESQDSLIHNNGASTAAASPQDGEKTPLKFQVYRDLLMMSDPPDILLMYQDLVK